MKLQIPELKINLNLRELEIDEQEIKQVIERHINYLCEEFIKKTFFDYIDKESVKRIVEERLQNAGNKKEVDRAIKDFREKVLGE